jgi:hypothetical protein
MLTQPANILELGTNWKSIFQLKTRQRKDLGAFLIRIDYSPKLLVTICDIEGGKGKRRLLYPLPFHLHPRTTYK